MKQWLKILAFSVTLVSLTACDDDTAQGTPDGTQTDVLGDSTGTGDTSGSEDTAGAQDTTGSEDTSGTEDTGQADTGPADTGAQDTQPEDTFVCPSARSCRQGVVCCDEGEECVGDAFCYPVCENTRCGDNASICCDAGEICLDGVVCAANCQIDEALCGDSLDICCSSGDVCLDNACVTPGDTCLDDFDCLGGGLYCEPTISRCLPNPSEPLCEIRPVFDKVELTLEWHWDGADWNGSRWDNVISSPVVGDITGDGIPDVVIPAYRGTTWHDPVLVALNGNDGTEIFVVGRDGATVSAEGEGVALANFDPSDDALEVAYRLDSGGVRIIDGDGTTELGLRIDANLRGTVEVADMNADGVPDIVLGCRVYSGVDISDSSLDIINQACAWTGAFEAPSIADLNGDGKPELVTGGRALQVDGTDLWDNPLSNSTNAVADLDNDGLPDVVHVATNVTVVKGSDGSTIFGPIAIPGGGTGGAPNIGDFDADGLPEIGTAGRALYSVYDPDCEASPIRTGGTCSTGTTNGVLWSVATQDLSSSVTGSSLFDFQGDSIAEVIYNDECFLHIYDGSTGQELLQDPIPNSSRTGYEYPIVVDVDRDGNSEIVVVANDDQAVGRDNCPAAYATAFGVPVSSLPAEYATGTHGVFVYGDASDRWVPTRPIWNQFSYHVTNITPDGIVPTVEPDNWSDPGLNNYRQNVQGGGIFNAPNLAVELEATQDCLQGWIILSAVVRNVGSRGVPAGIDVEFWQLTPTPETLINTVQTQQPLLPGSSERITLVVPDVAFGVDIDFEVRVDGATSGSADIGAVEECNETDNLATDSERCDFLN